jgi:hypothetical protein
VAQRYEREVTRIAGLATPTAPTPPAGAFGGQMGAAISAAGGGLAAIAEAQRGKRDTTAFMGAIGELNTSEQSLLHDPENGALRAQGADAAAAAQKALTDLDREAQRIMGGMNARTRQAFERSWQERRATAARTLSGHVAQEDEKSAQQTFAGAVESELNRAADNYGDLGVVGSALQSVEAFTRAEAHRRGLRDGAAVDALVRDKTSAVHSAVARRYVDAGRAADAAEYLAANRDEMTPEDASRLEGAIKPQADAQRALLLADDVWSEAGGDPAKAHDLLRDKHSKDPLRAAAADRIDERATREHNERSDRRRELTIEAYRTFKRDYRVGDIPAALMREIDEFDPSLGDWFRSQDDGARARDRAAREQGLQISKLERERAGLEAYSIAMAGAFTDPEEFIRTNLVVEFPSIDESHMTTLLNRQDALREQLRAGQKGLFDPRERLVNAAMDAGVIPRQIKGAKQEKWTEAQAEGFRQLETELDEWMRGQPKAPATPDVIEFIGKLTSKVKIRTGLRLGGVTIYPRFGRDEEQVAGTLTPDLARRVYVPAAEIPKESAKALRNLLQSQAETDARRTQSKVRTVTDEDLEDAYGQALVGARPDLAAALTISQAPTIGPEGDRARTRGMVRSLFLSRGKVPTDDELNRAVIAAIKNDGDGLRRILSER